MVTTGQGISIGILIFILLLIIVYVIVLFEAFKQQKFIFSPYIPPSPPKEQNAFYPLGNVRPLTQEEIDNRNRIIRNSLNIAT